MNRRDFITRTLVAAGAVAVNPFPYDLLAGTEKKYANDRIKLGPMQVDVSRMAMGTGTSGVGGSSNQTRKLGLSGLADLLVEAYDHGVTFWDSADQYGTHPHLKEALNHVPREKIQILTKTHATTEEEMRADLDRFRKELGTDYIDIMLLHLMTAENWPEIKKGAMNVISEAREEGIIRTHGVSCHSLPALKTASKTDWVQVDLARLNPAGVSMDDDVETVVSVLQDMKTAGKGVIGMKVFGAGRLTNRIDECLQYQFSADVTDTFTIGVENKVQLQDLLKRIPAASARV